MKWMDAVMTALGCCFEWWLERRRSKSVGGNKVRSMASAAILADVAPDPVLSEQRYGPIAVIVVLVVAALIIGIGVWRVLKRKRQPR